MSNKIDTIRRIFDNRFINTTPDIIQEPSENMKRLIVKGDISDEDYICLRLDQNIDLFPYLKNKEDFGIKGIKRICDYVIFVSKKDSVYALLIELKKGDEPPKKQLNLTEPLIKFVFDRARILGCWDSDVIVRKIAITDKPDRRPTNFRGDISYDMDSYVKLYCGKKIFLKRFIQ